MMDLMSAEIMAAHPQWQMGIAASAGNTNMETTRPDSLE
jgi:hypothetical protein